MALIEAKTNPFCTLESTDKTPDEELIVIQAERYDYLINGVIRVDFDPEELFEPTDDENGIKIADFGVAERVAVVSSMKDSLEDGVIPPEGTEPEASRDFVQKARASAVVTAVGLLSGFDVFFGTERIKNRVKGIKYLAQKSQWEWEPDTNPRNKSPQGPAWYRCENAQDENVWIRPAKDPVTLTMGNDGVGGAFALRLAVEPIRKKSQGAGTKQDPWEVLVTAGDWEIKFSEEIPELIIKNTVTENEKKVRVEELTKDAPWGRLMDLAFIPVWNGLLLVNPQFMQEEAKYKVLGHIEGVIDASVEEEVKKILKLDDGDPDEIHDENDANRKWPDEIELDDNDHLFQLDPLSVKFTRCGGRLNFRPVYFTPRGTVADVFSLGEDNDEDTIVPIYCLNTGGWTVRTQKTRNEDNETEIYAVMWEKGPGAPAGGMSDFRERHPFQSWGYVNPRNFSPADRGFKNETGKVIVNESRFRDIMQCSVTRSLENHYGTFLLDSYESGEAAQVVVGALQVFMGGGENTRAGQVFDGMVWGTGPQLDENSPRAFNFELRGLYQKLDDIRLPDSPPFDAFDHRTVVAYLCEFGGVECDLSDAEEYILRSTTDIHQWAVHFRAGTTVKDALDAVAAEAQYIWFITKDAVLKYLPVFAVPTDSETWDYATNEVLQLGATSELSHVHNYIMLGGEVGGSANTPTEEQKDLTKVPALQWGQVCFLTSELDTDPQFAWTRAIFAGWPGIFTREELERQLEEIKKRVSAFRWRGQMTVPGNADIELLDTIVVGGDDDNEFLVVSVNHNMDTQSKQWSTQMELEGKNF